MNYFILLLGIVAVLLLSIAAYYIYMRVKSTDVPVHSWPPVAYMQQVGTICPDMWNIGQAGATGTVRCVNPYARGFEQGCYDSQAAPFYKDFPQWTTAFNQWPMPPDARAKAADYQARKQWTASCPNWSWQGF